MVSSFRPFPVLPDFTITTQARSGLCFSKQVVQDQKVNQLAEPGTDKASEKQQDQPNEGCLIFQNISVIGVARRFQISYAL